MAGNHEQPDSSWMPPFVADLFPPADKRREHLVDGRLFRYPAFERAFTRLEELDDIEPSKLAEHSVLLVADSRAGKTRLVTEIIATRRPYWEKGGLKMPFVYLLVHEHPTIRSLACALLKQFGEEAGRRETADDVTHRVVVLCKACSVRAICFDDLHQFIDSNGELTQSSLSNWLRLLSVRASCALIAVGLPRLEGALRRNEQLYNRFDSKIRLNRFSWAELSDRKDFAAIVQLLHDGMSEGFKVETVTPELAFRWHLASGGRIGMMVKIARRAVLSAKRDKKRRISLEMLDYAWEQSDFDAPNVLARDRPFKLKIEDQDIEDLAAKALQKGLEAAPRSNKRQRPKSAKKRLRDAVAG